MLDVRPPLKFVRSASYYEKKDNIRATAGGFRRAGGVGSHRLTCAQITAPEDGTMRREEATGSNHIGWKFFVRALRYRNYRLFFAGQSVSLSGTWIQIVAVSWLIYRLTNSPLLLGIVAFAGQVPTFIIAPFAGVVADRFNRRKILIITQTALMLQALILAFLAISGHIAVWHIFILNILLGLASGFDIPARQAFVVDIIENKGDLINAIALNSSMFNAARLVGPSIAGIIIATAGEGACFLINGVTFLAVIFALLAIRTKPMPPEAKKSRILQDLKEGFVYTFSFRPIRYILLLLSLVSLCGMSYVVLMPIFAREILGGNSQTLGFLMAAAGLGALAGTIFLASRKDTRGLEKIITSGTAVFGLSLAIFSFSRNFWLSLLLLFTGGFGMMIQMGASNTVLQTLAHDDKRGRVMSFFAMAFMGMAPFGSLLAGALASKIGATHTLLLSGLSCLIGSAVFARKLSAQPGIPK